MSKPLLISFPSRLVGLIIISSLLGLMNASVQPRCFGQTEPASPATATESTQEALAQMLRDYVTHFNGRDLDSLAKLLADDVRYSDESANVSGSSALIAGLRRLVAEDASVKLSVEVSQVAVTDGTSASAAGTASLSSDSHPAEVNRFAVIFGKNGSRWVIQSIRESSDEANGSTAAREAIQSLSWLIGSWQDANDPTIQSTVRSAPGSQYLQRVVERVSEDETTQLAVEMIGYDPEAHLIRSWLFFADGSFATGVWRGTTDHCQIRLQQTMADGGKATGTYVIRPTSADSMTIQVISRVINGELQPNSQPVTLNRIQADNEAAQLDNNDAPNTSDSEDKR